MKRVSLILSLVIMLMPLASPAQQASPAPPKISFDFIDADIRNVLRVIAEVSKRNMVISDDVKGKVTIKLENVSCDDALDVILKNNDLAKVEGENVVRVMTAKKFYEERDRGAKERLEFVRERDLRQRLEQQFVTETVYVNYADIADVEKMITGETSASAKEMTQAMVPGAPGAPGAQSALTGKPKGLLSPNGVVTMVKWNNALVIKDTKENVAEVVRLIKEHDVPPKQVQINARIVLATSTFSKELGIQWGASYQTKVRGESVGSAGSKQVTGDSSATAYTAPTGNLGLRSGAVSFPYNVNLPSTMAAGTGGSMGVYLGSLTDSLAARPGAFRHGGRVQGQGYIQPEGHHLRQPSGAHHPGHGNPLSELLGAAWHQHHVQARSTAAYGDPPSHQGREHQADDRGKG